MNKKQLLLLASAIFGIIAFLHLIRSVLNWPVSVNNFGVPLFFSYFAAIILGFLAWYMYNASKRNS